MDAQIIINNFLDKGWPVDVVVLLFVQQVEIPFQEVSDLATNLLYACKHNIKTSFGEPQKFCNQLEQTEKICGKKNGAKLFQRKNVKFIRLKNDPETKCDFLRFRDFAMLLRVTEAKFFLESVKKDPNIEKKVVTTKKGYDPELRRIITFNETQKEFGKAKVNTFLNAEIFDFEKQDFFPFRKNLKQKGPQIGVDIVIRSPDGLLYYTGELIRVQQRSGPEKYIPKILTSDGDLAPLFWVKQGTAFNNAAISTNHMGKYYYIPSGPYKGHNHRSMQVVTLIKQIFDLNTKNEDLPKSPILTLPVGS